MMLRRLCIALCIATLATTAHAQDVRLAVAANFLSTAQDLVELYEKTNPDARVIISSASTGTLYAQILHGAPFDVFLAADSRRPQLLENKGKSVPGSRFTYALGRLALWSRNPKRVDPEGRVLLRTNIRRLAIANPKTAPYGEAARQTLKRLGLWSKYERRVVRGENVGQTLQFVASGNAQAGFVALSQIRDSRYARTGSHWIVPPELYARIEQQSVLIKRAADNQQARDFHAFLRSVEARELIAANGYGVVEAGR